VEDLSARTPWSQTSVGADGLRQLVSFVRPRWARRADGSWTGVDTALRRSGGAVVPAATVVPLAFSGGGTGALARLADGERELSVSWPGPLPVPVLSGASALYPEVLPGVDLRVTATEVGFSEVLVVKTRAAAAQQGLARVRLGVAGRGVAVRAASGGGLEAVDRAGQVVFAAPAPTMWDSSAEGAGFARTVVMPVQVGVGEIVVTPDAVMLADPATRYPVYIDPQWSGGQSGGVWKVIVSHHPDSSTFTLNNGALNGDWGAGRTCDSSSNGSCTSLEYKVRTLFRMNINGVRGKHVLQATFNVTQKWAWTCNPLSNAQLMINGGVTSTTTWNTQPAWDGAHAAQALGNHRRDGAWGCQGAGNVAFDATAMVRDVLALGWADLPLGLLAVDESTEQQWKRFDSATASLAVTYNTVPNTPDTLSTAGQSCVTGAGRPVVATAAPTLSARVTDPDGAGEGDINGTLQGEFTWEQRNPSTGTWSALGSGLGTPHAGGTTSPSPAPTFANGGIHRWRVRAFDAYWTPYTQYGFDVSAWTGWCEFEVDTVAPNTPVLTGDPGNEPFVAGKTARVTLSPGGSPADTDITGYTWWVVDGAGTHPATTVSGSTATVDWTPIAGQGTIFVRAKDRAQTSVNAGSYVFNAAQPSTETARWPLADPTGSTTAVDSTGNGHDATVTLGPPATLGAPGRIVNGTTALSLDGTSASVLTSPAVVDTTRNFTVSAWARVSDPSTIRGVVSQDGVHTSGFRLQFSSFCMCWQFVLAGTDVASPQPFHASAPTQAKLNVWTHLTGVYDAGTDRVKLYVNGALAGSAAGPTTPWNATGALRIGRNKWNDNPVDFFAGGIADVRVWNRTLSDPEIAAMVDPTDANNIATDVVGQWFVEPESCLGSPVTVCQDSSGYAHDVNLSGGVTTTTAGHTGSGLQYNATNGVAQSTDPNTGGLGPVLHTDASFTVAAWVKLDSMPNGNRTAVGQSGTKMSPFYFGTRMSGTTSYWAFAMVDTDTDSTPWRTALSAAAITTADVGQWFHLVGVYDAYAGTISLYVNGTLAGSATRTAAPWDAAGPLTIGAVLWTPAGSTPRLVDSWNGTIDTVTIYAGAVPAASVNRIP
jgi:Concanavalin A-like lectin/glucanases superfamily